ncbi:aminoglycoside phosphotransferase family protein [Kitasatospora sp. GAS1066B]|uniref:aminoglycoside phosphotransferase family protein n=1 Tax=Kitasatospora sp. GAS1066B TaxID=3156271 RepID=UPI003516D00A
MITRRDSSSITEHAESKVLAAHGLTAANLLAAGTEARVYALSADRVLKIYADPDQRGALDTLADFYQRLDRASVPCALPLIQHIEQDGPLLAVTETRLPGNPMGDVLDLTAPESEATYLEAVTDLAGLRLTVPLGRRMLLTHPQQPDAGPGDWNAFLAELLHRKLPAVLPELEQDVPGIQDLAWRLLERLDVPYAGPEGVIHGDLYPDNLLVSEGKVTAVIDFGTFTMIGDPLYDLAGACIYYRMYDSDRAEVRSRLLQRASSALTSPRQQQLTDYVHLIALLSCDLYPEPQAHIRTTGHYQWAADVLNSPTDWMS